MLQQNNWFRVNKPTKVKPSNILEKKPQSVNEWNKVIENISTSTVYTHIFIYHSPVVNDLIRFCPYDPIYITA